MQQHYQGKRLNLDFYEVHSLFERNLAFFRHKARHFYNHQLPRNATKVQKQVWEERRRADFAHLELEAKHLENLSGIYELQEVYREEARGLRNESPQQFDERESRMTNEKWHPTEALEMNMRACGKPKPTAFHSAHHIVPGKGKLHRIINQLRVQMILLGIGINDGDNGAWMLKRKDDKQHHWFSEQPDARSHLEIHTHAYEKWLDKKLNSLRSEKTFRAKLREIGFLLESQPENFAVAF